MFYLLYVNMSWYVNMVKCREIFWKWNFLHPNFKILILRNFCYKSSLNISTYSHSVFRFFSLISYHLQSIMGKLSLFQIINFCISFIGFRFCQPCSNQESVEHCQWEKQHLETIQASGYLQMTCCNTWHSHCKLQYKNFTVFGYSDLYSYWWKPPCSHHGVWCGH